MPARALRNVPTHDADEFGAPGSSVLKALDGGRPDGVIASDAGAPTLTGVPDKFDAGDAAPAATDVVMVDLDGNGSLDAVLSTAQGAQWLAR